MLREEFSQARWQIVLSKRGENLALAAKAATCYDSQSETWEFLAEMRALGAARTLTGPTLILADAFKYTAGLNTTALLSSLDRFTSRCGSLE